ncbi:alpha/beta fold hydrolase [Spongiimicrobium salis]|uniref:alpha/beta fold hydrolase n=1 Tax=Spongiimicrobium salis TaxID=1667022 RepID=UPI00374DC6B2
MKKPETKYTKSYSVNVAYQVFGSGDIDLVYIPGWISNIDLMWACPELVSFLSELGKIARVILFDKRGTGLSDRVIEFPTLEERMDDIRAVMDAVNAEKAVLFGHSEGGSVSALFAATYPNRTISLITFGIFAKRVYAPDYPWAPTCAERQKVYDCIEKNWGSGEMNLESLAPSKADDTVFMDWLANYFRSGASPSAALKLTKMNTQVDIINILDAVKVPTLMLQRRGDIDVKIEEGRFIEERIENAKLVEFEGSDHLFWTDNTQEVLEEMKSFILNVKPKSVYEKQLYTIVVGRFIPSNKDNPKSKDIVDQAIEQHRGALVHYNTETFIATFDGPSKAANCSMDLMNAFRELHIPLAIGIHIKECIVGNCISKEVLDFSTFMDRESVSNQILLTQTVKNLLVGTDLAFTTYKTIFKTVSGNSFLLYTVKEKIKQEASFNAVKGTKLIHDDTFLEGVLQSINTHLNNECFGVEMLCRELAVSERQLQRKLKEMSQISPNQLISSMRLNFAKELILNREGTISEIAFKAGFSNPSYFSKCFKKKFDISPSDLRN